MINDAVLYRLLYLILDTIDGWFFKAKKLSDEFVCKCLFVLYHLICWHPVFPFSAQAKSTPDDGVSSKFSWLIKWIL